MRSVDDIRRRRFTERWAFTLLVIALIVVVALVLIAVTW